MNNTSNLLSGKIITVALVAALIGFFVGQAKRDRIEKTNAKAVQTYAERQAALKAKEEEDLKKAPGERIYTTSRGELIVMGVNIKPKGDQVQTVACFVWIGKEGQTAMDCPQNPIDIDELVNQRLDEQAEIADERAQGLDHTY